MPAAVIKQQADASRAGINLDGAPSKSRIPA
jgi:hypothetical protein